MVTRTTLVKGSVFSSHDLLQELFGADHPAFGGQEHLQQAELLLGETQITPGPLGHMAGGIEREVARR